MEARKKILWTMTLVAYVVVCGVVTAQAQGVHAQTSTLAPRVAPGEILPLVVRLSNFGNNNRVDVTVRYTIEDTAGSVVTNTSETVAVETTSSYVKNIPLPNTIHTGQYLARVEIIYADQKVPATATYQFTVEKKLFGFFVTDLLLYGCGVLVVVLGSAFLIVVFLSRRAQKTLIDYSHVPREVRVYYEIVSDTIQQMRLHKGNDAIDLAAEIPGLVIEKNTGRVVEITGDPSDTIALLVDTYEHSFGKKVNLSLGVGGGSRALIR